MRTFVLCKLRSLRTVDVKLRVERNVLAEAVAWAVRGLSQRPPVPVLAGVLLEATPEGLTLSAFDYEVSAKVTVDADVEDPGTVLVQGRLLADISKSLPNKPIELLSDGSKVQVTCGSAKFQLHCMPTGEYPTLPESPEPTGVIGGDVFTQAVAQVSVAADRGDTLPILTGVRIEVEGNKLTLLATDRYRLAMREVLWNANDENAECAALVPARTLDSLAKALGASGSVSLSLTGASTGSGLAGFEAAQRRMTTRLLDGDYPKVTSLFPTNLDTTAVVETSALMESVKRVSLVAERNMPVRLKFAEESVRIEAGSGEEASASEVLEARIDGPDIEIAFSPQFLLDGLGVLGAPYVRLGFTQPTRPAVMSGAEEIDGEVDESYRYLIMPVRFAS